MSELKNMSRDEINECLRMGLAMQLKDPRQRILAIEEAIRAICQSADEDAADGVMALLTAAVHITMRHSDLSKAELPDVMAGSLANAIIAAESWFAADRSPAK